VLAYWSVAGDGDSVPSPVILPDAPRDDYARVDAWTSCQEGRLRIQIPRNRQNGSRRDHDYDNSGNRPDDVTTIH
jgi:hypothetical protein